MINQLINPQMIAREIACLVASKIKPLQNYEACGSGILGWVNYGGVIININKYNNDDNFYFEIVYKHINFMLTLKNKDFDMSIDDFAEFKIKPELDKKLEYFGFATWD